MTDRPQFPSRAVVTAGMPYGNKGLHFGHMGGVFVPADVCARFLRDRIGTDNVLFVSGTDCYGSPIMEGYRKEVEAGDFEGSLLDYVQRNHDEQAATIGSYDISLDVFEGSALGDCGAVHEEVTDAFIRRLYEAGWLEKRSNPQFYDEEAQTFLNGRQVVGRCPVQGCKSEKAYADECDLGHQFLPQDLIAPVSTLSGKTPVMRDVTNWYFKLPELRTLIEAHADAIEGDERTRPVLTSTMREFLVPPIIYIKCEREDAYRELADRLPAHTYLPPEKGKQSFALEFSCLEDREAAKAILDEAGIFSRTGKALVPFRLTGNIDWGVPAPSLEGEEDLTVWCWPESLWAPISFTVAALRERGIDDADAWRDWWCSGDAEVYQFIGQDNIYFYGVAQTALFAATQDTDEPQAEAPAGDLRQTTLVPNHHLLFLNKKASSSGEVKPPMADELLDYYTVEQLRAHWIALGLGLKSVSFAPKPLDPNAKEGAPDPVLKEGTLLTNVFNRLARSCFYTAQKYTDGAAPLGEVTPALRTRAEEVICEYERGMYRFEYHAVMALMDDYIREANKYWSSASREASSADDEAGAMRQVLCDSFYLLRVITVLMHPIVPQGCELIFEQLDIEDHSSGAPHAGFFSWEHIFEGLDFWASDAERDAGSFSLKELPPRFDFFKKHESQYE